jgi:hypothetical protein
MAYGAEEKSLNMNRLQFAAAIIFFGSWCRPVSFP